MSTASSPAAAAAPRVRLESLDALRGLVIIAMLLVNNKPVQFHRQFDHAPWGQFITMTDLIFPWFLFMIGCALPFSRASALNRGVTRRQYYVKVVRRSAILVLLGCVIYSAINFTGGKYRLALSLGGVLQPIGLAYLAGALLYELRPQSRYLFAAGILVVYWLVIRFVPVPGVGEPRFTEKQSVMHWINVRFLSPAKQPFADSKFGFDWGLSGLLSIPSMAALVIIGSFAGDVLRGVRDAGAKLLLLAATGGALTGIGLLWHLDLMMNKDYWTPSYICFTGGLAMTTLAALFLLIDMRGWRRLAFPLVVYGMNAITAYFISIMVRVLTLDWIRVTEANGKHVSLKTWIVHSLEHVLPWKVGVDGTVGDAVFITGYIGFWWIVLYIMYRRKWFWRV